MNHVRLLLSLKQKACCEDQDNARSRRKLQAMQTRSRVLEPAMRRTSLSFDVRQRGYNKLRYAAALGRAEIASRQRRTLPRSSGMTSFDSFIKSTAASAVMSATVNSAPAT